MSVNIDNYEALRRGIDSPKTLEAALRCGVDIDELCTKELSYFVDRAEGHKVNLAKVMAEHYEERRKMYIVEVKLERKRVMAEILAVADAERAKQEAWAKMGDEERRRIAMAAKNDIEAERKRAEMLREKQQADMMNDLQKEIKLAEDAKMNAEKAQQAEAAEKLRQKAREAARLKAVEARRAEELEKAEEEGRRAEELRKIANAEHAAEKKKQEVAAKAAKALVIKRKQEEEAARIAQMEADRAREAEIAAKQQDLARRIEEMKIKDAERAEKMAEFTAKMKAESDARAAEQAVRMEAARLKDLEVLASKRQKYFDSVAEAERRKAEKAVAEAEQAEKDRKAREAKEKRRLLAVQRTLQDDKARSDRLRGAIDKAEAHMEEVKVATRLANEERALKEILHMADKLEAIKRQRRKEEYGRLRNMSRITAEQEKMDHDASERETMAKERQANQRKVLLAKAHMEEEMEKMRIYNDFGRLQKMMGAGKPEAKAEEKGAA